MSRFSRYWIICKDGADKISTMEFLTSGPYSDVGLSD
jgi:hypothetical protein